DRPENQGSLPESERPKREPPTIDLEATEVTTETAPASAAASAEATAEAPSEPPVSQPAPTPVSPWIVAPVSGAVAAALVIGVGWMLGWPAVQPAAAPPAPQLNAAAIDDLTGRVAGLETKISKPAAPVADPAASARMEALEKSLAALRGDLATTRAQSEKLASGINELKSAPRADGTPAPDLSGINGQIAKLESAVQAQAAEIAQQSSKIANAKAADAKPADDLPLRRVVAAALLDVLVRTGDPYPAALAAAKAVAPNAEALKPLEAFAATGVPNANKLSSELLTLVPKLTPAAPPDTSTAGSGIVERLQAGAAKLVKIERTDTSGSDRGAVVARMTAAALRNDFNEARRELKTLAPADRAAAQAWLDKADARDAALTASRQFAADAMNVLAKPAQ
ncbi:MAG: COG4223 family protein, partial [Bradyrhizobium sp.]